MPNHVLLIGAGFTRNWGGPLSEEVTGSLLNDLHNDQVLSAALLRAPFEEVFGGFVNQPSNHAEAERLRNFQGAIVALFERINKSFSPAKFEWQDENSLIGIRGVRHFLASFDAIFTLNQDLLLEICYMQQLPLGGRWNSAILPAMLGRQQPDAHPLDGPEKFIWTPNGDMRIDARSQPIFKLHGSSNWMDDGGKPVLIIGSGKSGAIQRYPVLKEYHAQFATRLKQPDTRLMIIGYSFQDEHINAVIENASSSCGLLTFLVDPNGRKALIDPKMRDAGVRPVRDIEKIRIFGEIRRPLSEFMGKQDSFAYGELMRFFR